MKIGAIGSVKTFVRAHADERGAQRKKQRERERERREKEGERERDRERERQKETMASVHTEKGEQDRSLTGSLAGILTNSHEYARRCPMH